MNEIPIPEPETEDTYESKLHTLAQQVAFGNEVAQDDWWDRNWLGDKKYRAIIEAYIDSKLLKIGDLVYAELIKKQ
jgi:hypothetical protein